MKKVFFKLSQVMRRLHRKCIPRFWSTIWGLGTGLWMSWWFGLLRINVIVTIIEILKHYWVLLHEHWSKIISQWFWLIRHRYILFAIRMQLIEISINMSVTSIASFLGLHLLVVFLHHDLLLLLLLHLVGLSLTQPVLLPFLLLLFLWPRRRLGPCVFRIWLAFPKG